MLNPKSPAQQVKTQTEIVEVVDRLLDDHVYSEIAAILNQRGFRPGGSARPGRGADRFTAKHVAYLMHTYGLCSRYDRLRQRGMLSKKGSWPKSVISVRRAAGAERSSDPKSGSLKPPVAPEVADNERDERGKRVAGHSPCG